MVGTHTVTFSRLRANFTVDKDILGKQDPYVIFTSGHAKAQTKAIKGVGTGTAEWKESYTLEEFSPSQSSVIEVSVYNHNTLLPDSIIGSGTIDLSSQGQSSLSGQGEPVSVVLNDKKGQEVGTLQFLVNGGGYSGSGSGTRGSGVGTGAGALGAGAAGAGAGNVVGKGTGTDQRTAQEASDAAAARGTDVAIDDNNRVGVGHPTSGTGSRGLTGAGTGASTGTGGAVGSAGSGLTGSHSHAGTGGAAATAGSTGTSATTGSRGVTGTGVGTGAAGAGVYGEKEGDIIDRKYYTGTESRPQDQALVEQYREHNPYAKDYETTVQHTGRERLVNSQIEALGTRERVVGQDHHVHAHPHHEIARNLPAGAVGDRVQGEGWVQAKPGPICDSNTFSITGDRTVDKERVTDLREHREFEKEFEAKTRLVGERALDRGAEAEILNRERVLVDEKNKNACEGHPPASAAAAGGQTLAGSGTGTGVGGAGYGGTGTGVGGAGYGGTGTRQTAGEKAASYVPGTEENREKKAAQGTGTGIGGAGYGGTEGAGYGGTGTGIGGAGYGGTGTRQTAGEKAASYVPGTEENREKKAAQGTGTGIGGTGSGIGGTGSGVGGTGKPTAGEKAASYVPGTQENREKKAAQGTY